ncbi:MAG: plastocyanin/azurin family copper-binding protein [Pseudomonadota bacterium]
MLTLLSSVITLLAAPVFAAEFEVSQKDKQFTASTLKIKVGDTIKFKNEDPFPHNVYSLSEIQTFDLGSHGQGAVKSVVFTKPGIVEVECAVHPSMKLIVDVSK